MKYIVTSSGLEAREKNPHPEYVQSSIPHIKMGNYEFKAFEASVKTYPLTQPMEAGSEIEGDLVWQIRARKSTEWKPFPSKYKIINIDSHSTYTLNGWIYDCRQALKPLVLQPEKVKEEIDKMDFTEFQVQLRNCLIIKDGFDNNWMNDFYADYKEDFGIKITVKEWAEDFFQDVTLTTHSYCLVSKLAAPIENVEQIIKHFDLRIKKLKNAIHPYDQGRLSGFEAAHKALTDLITQMKGN